MPPHETGNAHPGLEADPLIRQVLRTIARHDMLHPGDKVLAGVSSGPDSVVLLDVLHRLAGHMGFTLGVGHLDHGMRSEAAEAEKNLVHGLCRRFGLAFHAEKLQGGRPRGSLEEHLRHLRYDFFDRIAATHGYTKIAVGHHADDNAEAVLMHLMRGSGLRGLSGIPPVRENKIIRPLIDIRRRRILAYAQRRALPYMTDASNYDARFERNKIRHQLIPLLERQYNPNLVRTLNRTAELCREEEGWIASYAGAIAARMITRSTPQLLEVRTALLKAAPKGLQRQLVRSVLKQWQGHLRRMGAAHVESLLSLVRQDDRERRLHLPGRVTAESLSGVLRFRRVDNPREPAMPCVRENDAYVYVVPAIEQSPLDVSIPEAGIRLRFAAIEPLQPGPLQFSEERMVLLDADRLTFPLVVRNFRSGDGFQPFGLSGRQKVKKLLIDRKIPKARRNGLPLLISADTVLWVVGVRRGSGAALSPETTRVLRVQADPL